MAITKLNIEDKLNKEIASLVKKNQSLVEYNIPKDITYEDFLENKMLIICTIKKGVPYSLFNLLLDYAPFSENEWAGFLHISTKSLHRFKTSPSHFFKPVQSEKIIEMAEVIKKGLEVFGSMDKLKLWLDTPNYALGKLKPIDLLNDSYGKELVISELIRVDHGILV